MEPDRLVPLPDGRRVAVDDRGAPDGVPVLYLHGTPDSRLARHPDDGAATRRGVRLLCPDRPGVGDSDPDPGATPSSVSDDLVAVLDAWQLDRVHLLAWSAGAIFAAALAGAHPERVGSITLAAPLIPADAYGDGDVLAGADDGRRMFAEVLDTMTPDQIGAEMAMWLVPPEIDDALARDLLATSIAAVTSIPGAGDQLVRSLRAAVAVGTTGIERELAAQAIPLDGSLDRIAAPTRIHAGTADTVAPPAMALWWARRLDCEVTVHDGLPHALPLLRWEHLLAEIVERAGRQSRT